MDLLFIKEAINSISFTHWMLLFYTFLIGTTSASASIFDGRLPNGVRIIQRLQKKVSKEIKFNFKKELLELTIAFILICKFLILFIVWYQFFDLIILILSLLLIGIASFIGNLTDRDPFFSIKNAVFERLREKHILFYTYDFIAIIFIFYFISVINF